MQSTSDIALEGFRTVARKWADGYHTMIRSAFALRYENEWHLQNSVTFFLSAFQEDQGQPPEPVYVETASILGIREVVAYNDDMLDTYLTGDKFDPFAMSIGGFKLIAPDQAYRHLSYYFESMHRRDFPSNWRFPAITATGGNQPDVFNSSNLDRLNLELMSNAEPFQNIDDLLVGLGLPRSPHQFPQTRPMSTFVVSHPAVVSPETTIEGDELRIVVQCDKKLDFSAISAGVRAFSRDQPVARMHVSQDRFDWSTDGKWATGIAKLTLSEHPIAAIHLSYDSEFIGLHFATDPKNSLNSRLVVHKQFHDERNLDDILVDGKGTAFEDRVTLLLSMLGLSCVPYGDIGHFKDGPDILAYSGRGHLYVIECTVGDVARDGKIGKLKRRADRILKANQEFGLGIQHVIPVIFTNLELEDTRAHWAEAGEVGVALVCRENIKGLIRRLETPPNHQELFEAALAAIPPKAQPPSG